MKVRAYWSVGLLALLATGFLGLARSSINWDGIAAVGFGFAGAAVTRLVDIAQERRRENAARDDRRRTDLDETRRLAYMVLYSGGKASNEAVVTLSHALAHHGLGESFDNAFQECRKARNSGPDHEQSAWLRSQIVRINAELGL